MGWSHATHVEGPVRRTWRIAPGDRIGLWNLDGEMTASDLPALELTQIVQRRPWDIELVGRHTITPTVAGAAIVVLLRELQSVGLIVHWAGGAAGVASEDLAHLSPPEAEDNDLSVWRARHRYGLFYYRSGPNFVSIVDRRRSADANRYVIYDPDLLAVFHAGLAEDARIGSQNLNEDAVQTMREERIVIPFGGGLVTLPCRMRRWPVPFDAI